MRRTPYRIDPAIRREVMLRDKACFLSKVEPRHVCRDVWGVAHAPDLIDALTLEHVHRDGSMMGKRAPSDAAHLLALCGMANFMVPNRSQRDSMRAHLRALYRAEA